LACKTWKAKTGDDAFLVSRQDTSATLSSSADSGSERPDDSDDDIEKQDAALQSNHQFNKNKAGSVCPICSEKYREGESVYESNNIKCCHQAHKKCMDKWLTIQNSCPICSQPFALHGVRVTA